MQLVSSFRPSPTPCFAPLESKLSTPAPPDADVLQILREDLEWTRTQVSDRAIAQGPALNRQFERRSTTGFRDWQSGAEVTAKQDRLALVSSSPARRQEVRHTGAARCRSARHELAAPVVEGLLTQVTVDLTGSCMLDDKGSQSPFEPGSKRLSEDARVARPRQRTILSSSFPLFS